jgi:hypothetical protein
MVGIKH